MAAVSKRQPREFERDGRKAEIIGPRRRCLLLIDGRQYPIGFASLRAARLAFFDYCKRHPRA